MEDGGGEGYHPALVSGVEVGVCDCVVGVFHVLERVFVPGAGGWVVRSKGGLFHCAGQAAEDAVLVAGVDSGYVGVAEVGCAEDFVYVLCELDC